MSFFRTLQSSVYSPTFYRTITQRPLSSALGYVLLLLLALTVVRTVRIAPVLVSDIPEALESSVPSFLAFAFLGLYLLYAFRLVYLFLLAVGIWLLLKAFHWSVSYGQAYKVGLYAMTAAFLVEMVVELTSAATHFSGFAFMFTAITLLVVLVNAMGTQETRPAETLPPS